MDVHDAVGVQLTEIIDSGVGDKAIDEPHLQAALAEAREGRDLLIGLTPHPTPVGFSRRVQTRVRRRTGGRFFHPANRPFGYVVSVEAFVVLAVAVMAACWLMLDSSKERLPTTLYPDPPTVETPVDTPKGSGAVIP